MSRQQSRISYGTVTSPADHTYGEVTIPGDRWTGAVRLRMRLVTVGDPYVYVVVSILPDLRRAWSAPPSATMRRYVDTFLTGSGLERTGRREPRSVSNGWGYVYPVEPQNRP